MSLNDITPHESIPANPKARIWSTANNGTTSYTEVSTLEEALTLLREVFKSTEAGLEYYDPKNGEWWEWQDAEGNEAHELLIRCHGDDA